VTKDTAAITTAADIAQRHAVAVQDHPGFQAACARLEAHYTNLFRTSEPADKDGREDAFFMLRALDALKQDIASAAVGGAVTHRNLRSRAR
jgi:hypothetical protein